jgi:hypothetical protein
VDPFAVLGVKQGASREEVARAYRRLAKRWHPDTGGGRPAEETMARINAAYDLLRESVAEDLRAAAKPSAAARARRATPAAWLPRHVRQALGRELTQVLQAGEPVAFVTPTALWASPHALLAVTDRRLLWLLDDAVSHRVRWLRFRAVAAVHARPSWPLRRRAVLRVEGTDGRRLAFADLRPRTAATIARHVLDARA